MAKILILAEHDEAGIKAATLCTITAAQQCADQNNDITLLLCGKDNSKAAEQASKIPGVTQVISAQGDSVATGLPENIAPLIKELCDQRQFQYILASSSTYGKNILPRVAALLDVSMLSDVMKILPNQTYMRPIYAGNVLATYQSSDAIQVMTIRTTSFDKAKIGDNASAQSGTIQAPVDAGLSKFVSSELSKSERPELTSARIVISGGRGLGSGENFKLIERIADQLGAAIGASRAAVDAGYVPNDYQVGQTGKIVAPDLYIAVGISGAIQHLAGMKDSKIIVAINKDEDAPIFQIADYGIVGDLFKILPELESRLPK